MRKVLLFLCLISSCLVSVGVAAEVVITEARIKAPIPGRTTTAAYMNLRNTGAKPVALVAARSSLASSIEMHEIVREADVSGMRQRAVVVLPVAKTVAFKTGGLHLMVFGVTQKLGDTVEIELYFDDDTTQIARFKTEAW